MNTALTAWIDGIGLILLQDAAPDLEFLRRG